MDSKNTLKTIRSSIRVMFLYTDKILSLFRYIKSILGLTYSGGSVEIFGSPSPRNGKGNLENWAWDWVNMNLYQFSFLTIKDEYINFLLQSDTGYWDGGDDSIFKIDKFKDVNDSQSRLIIIFSNKKIDTEIILDSEIMKSSVNEIIIPYKKTNIYCKAYDLSNFFDESSTIEALKDFINYFKIEGLKIKECI